MAKAVRRRYLGTDQAQRDRHTELAGYFQRKGDPRAEAKLGIDFVQDGGRRLHLRIQSGCDLLVRHSIQDITDGDGLSGGKIVFQD